MANPPFIVRGTIGGGWCKVGLAQRYRDFRTLAAGGVVLVVTLAASSLSAGPAVAATADTHVLVRVAPGAEASVAEGVRALAVTPSIR